MILAVKVVGVGGAGDNFGWQHLSLWQHSQLALIHFFLLLIFYTYSFPFHHDNSLSITSMVIVIWLDKKCQQCSIHHWLIGKHQLTYFIIVLFRMLPFFTYNFLSRFSSFIQVLGSCILDKTRQHSWNEAIGLYCKHWLIWCLFFIFISTTVIVLVLGVITTRHIFYRVSNGSIQQLSLL